MPSSRPYSRSRDAPNAWKVLTVMPALRLPSSAASRSAISSAALFVNVMARIDSGATPCCSTRKAIRWVSVRVLPVPGPAEMTTERSTHCTASRCASFRPPSRAATGTVKPPDPATGASGSKPASRSKNDACHPSPTAVSSCAVSASGAAGACTGAPGSAGSGPTGMGLDFGEQAALHRMAGGSCGEQTNGPVLAVVARLRVDLAPPHTLNTFGQPVATGPADLFEPGLSEDMRALVRAGPAASASPAPPAPSLRRRPTLRQELPRAG